MLSRICILKIIYCVIRLDGPMLGKWYPLTKMYVDGIVEAIEKERTKEKRKCLYISRFFVAIHFHLKMSITATHNCCVVVAAFQIANNLTDMICFEFFFIFISFFLNYANHQPVRRTYTHALFNETHIFEWAYSFIAVNGSSAAFKSIRIHKYNVFLCYNWLQLSKIGRSGVIFCSSHVRTSHLDKPYVQFQCT